MACHFDMLVRYSVFPNKSRDTVQNKFRLQISVPCSFSSLTCRIVAGEMGDHLI